MGFKYDAESYREINLSLGRTEDPSLVLFVSDSVLECVAARAAGMKVLVAVRPGNAPLPMDKYTYTPWKGTESLDGSDASDINNFFTCTTFDLLC